MKSIFSSSPRRGGTHQEISTIHACAFGDPFGQSGYAGSLATRDCAARPVYSGTSGLFLPAQPPRHELMKDWRSWPFMFFRFACLLQSPILSCWAFCFALGALACVPPPPLRQPFMNFLRSSPFSFFSPASL